MGSQVRKCLSCGLLLDPSEFAADKRMKDGLAVQCKDCPTVDTSMIPARRFMSRTMRENMIKQAQDNLAPARTFVPGAWVPQTWGYVRQDRNAQVHSYGAPC